tara:strand:+ start:8497 stop:8718 length:222 start_codon:yes stop_codon:yes gene_type:complete
MKQFNHEQRKQIFQIYKMIDYVKNELNEIKYEVFENEEKLSRCTELEEKIDMFKDLLFTIQAPTKQNLDKDFI